MSDIINAAHQTISERWVSICYHRLTPKQTDTSSVFTHDAAFLAKNISDIAGRTLTMDGVTVFIATTPNRRLIEKRLVRRGFDLERRRAIDRYVTLDAPDILALLTLGGWPDEDRFGVIIGDMIRQAIHNSGNRNVFAFGEMVALLCAAHRPDAAIRLEQLWNSLLAQYRFSLYCAYPLRDFVSEATLNSVFQICAEHSLTIPAETRL